MDKISIISSSIRPQRGSHRVALYFNKYLGQNNLALTEIIDLKEYNFPLFDNTLKIQKNPPANAVAFAEKIKSSAGIIIVTPEYNGGIPASLKNAIDLLYEEWRHKPIGIVTVSSGPFGGSQVLLALQFTLWKMKAYTIPAFFSVSNVQDSYDNDGNPIDKITADKMAATFTKELLHSMNIIK